MPGRSSFTDQPDIVFGGGKDPISNPFANAAAAVMPSAGRSPMSAAATQAPSKSYSGLFDPSASGIRGIIGGIMGNPTRQEFQQQQTGDRRAKAFSKLSDAIEAGVPPQKALLQFVNTPEGMDFMTTSTEPMAELAQFMKQVGAETGDPFTLSGNDVRYDGQGKVIAQGPGPEKTEAERSFDALATIANFTPEQKQRAAELKLMGGSGNETQREAALKQLVDGGIMDPVMAQKWLSGVISKVPIKDEQGNVTGEKLVDWSNGQEVFNGQPNAANMPKPKSDLDEEPLDNQTNKLQAIVDMGGKPADVVDGAGPFAAMGEKIGGLLGNLPGFSKMGGSIDAVKRTGMRQIVADANTLLDTYSKNNRASAVDTKNINEIIGGITGLQTNPKQVANKLISFNYYLDQKERQSKLDYNNPNLNKQQRGDAAAELAAITDARANLPDVESLKAKLAELETQPSEMTKRLPDIKEGIKAGIGDAEEVVSGQVPGEKPAAPTAEPAQPDRGPQSFTFKTLEEAKKKGGFQVGDKLIINGEEIEVGPPKGKK